MFTQFTPAQKRDYAIAMRAREDAADRAYEQFCAEQFDHRFDEAIKAAYAARVQVGTMERGSYYDTTTWLVAIDGPNANQVRAALAAGDGQSMASYGTFGGYSTIGNVKAGDEPGTFLVESVYHIGD